jgi:hypothetical protein
VRGLQGGNQIFSQLRFRLEEGSTPEARILLVPVFINKVLLKQCHAHSFNVPYSSFGIKGSESSMALKWKYLLPGT